MESMKFMLDLIIFLLTILLYSTSVKRLRINTFVHQEAWVETKTKATRDRGRDRQKDRQTDRFFLIFIDDDKRIAFARMFTCDN